LSRSEGFGLVLAEAAAAGVPILLRSCGGVSDLFTHAVDAMFFESVDDLYENLRRLDPLSARVGIARAARKLTEDHLDRERMLSEYQKLFSAL
jgi:glycosyltransferase involved in cell wall biosynthesis